MGPWQHQETDTYPMTYPIRIRWIYRIRSPYPMVSDGFFVCVLGPVLVVLSYLVIVGICIYCLTSAWDPITVDTVSDRIRYVSVADAYRIRYPLADN